MEQPKQPLYMPAEWHNQQMVQLTWPHENTDWHYMLDEVEACYVKLAAAISTPKTKKPPGALVMMVKGSTLAGRT